MKTPLFYWADGPLRLYFLGNPVVWWGSTLLLLLVGAGYLSSCLSEEKTACSNTKDGRLLWIPVVGYIAAYAPMMEIKRIMFMYHYLMPLTFSIMAGMLWLDRIGWIRSAKGLLQQRIGYYLTIAALIIGFVYISPFTYAFEGWSSATDKMLHIFPHQ